MANDDHYAILLTINRYPGLDDLDGPENDGLDLMKWLLDPQYGDLPSNNIHLIRSSDFGEMKNADDANPTELHLKKALNQWLRIPDGWRDRLGKRLYLFFAGHGFTAGSHIADPALFSAVAQNDDTAHIAVFRYASKIANAGFFDEIIIIMDCCQDVLKASQVIDPTWSPPDRQRSSNVRLFQAYGAPRGRKSFEREIGFESRGLFSSVLMEALRNAPAEADGWVTDRTVKDLFTLLWEARYKAETGYTPPLRSPDSDRIRFYRRDLRKSDDPRPPPAPPRITVDLSKVIARSIEIERLAISELEPVSSSASNLDVALNRRHWIRGEALRKLDSSVVGLEPGLHVVITSEGQPDLAFEVPYPAGSSITNSPLYVPVPVPVPALLEKLNVATPVALAASDPNTEIVVVNEDYATVGMATGALSLTLKPGLYKALTSIGTVSTQMLFTVADVPLNLTMAAPFFPSAAPVSGASTTHEYQSGPAAALAMEHVDANAGDGELFVFVRDSCHAPGSVPVSELPWRQLQVVRLTGQGGRAKFVHKHLDDRHGYACIKGAAAAGSFALMIGRTGSHDRSIDDHVDGFIVPVITNWRTEVYIDCTDAIPDASDTGEGSSRTLDLASAAFHLVRMGRPSLLFDPIGLATEAARAQLALGRPVATPPPEVSEVSPMWALYAALAAWQNSPTRAELIHQSVLSVPEEVREGLCDFALIARWLEPLDGLRPLCDPPILADSWSLARQLETRAGLAPEVVEEIGQWRTGGSLWATWRRPRRLISALSTSMSAEAKANAQTGQIVKDDDPADSMPVLKPQWALDVWAPVAAGLRRSYPYHSPFQRALRRRILDAIAEGIMPDSDAFALASEFMLSRDYAVRAYQELYEYARGDGIGSMGGETGGLSGPDPISSAVNIERSAVLHLMDA